MFLKLENINTHSHTPLNNQSMLRNASSGNFLVQTSQSVLTHLNGLAYTRLYGTYRRICSPLLAEVLLCGARLYIKNYSVITPPQVTTLRHFFFVFTHKAVMNTIIYKSWKYLWLYP